MMKRTTMLISMIVFVLALAGCMNEANNDSNGQEMKAGTEDSSERETAKQMDSSDTSADQSSSDVEIIKDERKGIVPVTIEIPAIDVKTKVEHVGTLNDGRMDVPKDADNVGWYKPGTMPGAQGNSVIAGHVDDLTSPAVFYHLHKLKSGDEIIVEDESGQKLTFKVVQSDVYPRQDAPIENIFGFSYRSMLNLITCTGEYDPNTTEREERLVVSAELVKNQ
ncbi:sortase domain-containing protein [Pseudalkalibacillus sp. Hm43]|uniref:class F sortase n=1 Tax=Pseudalkalibacillus sp. Hm43 TaxID=3450742 RepID=UPI003F42BCA9